LGVIVYEYFTGRPAITEDTQTDSAIFFLCIWIFFWKKIVLQKNVYKMRITEVGGQANYWADIPENINIFFRWTVGIG
ncbi:hypothetical protein QN391_25935, partial [Pseudomonas sp. CCI1.2]